MKKIKPFIVDYKLYPFNVAVFFGHEEKDVKRWLARRYDTNREEDEILQMYGKGKTVMLEGGQTILWMPFIPNKGDQYLAHEIFHAVQFLFDRIGITLSRDSDEAYAYAIQYLTNEINKKL